MSAAFKVAVDQNAGEATVIVAGELDLATAPKLARALTVCANRSRHVTLDASRLEFIDCAGLRCILEANRRMPLAVVPGSGPVRQLLALTGADRRLRLASPTPVSRAA